jgi:hypothetical protein
MNKFEQGDIIYPKYWPQHTYMVCNPIQIRNPDSDCLGYQIVFLDDRNLNVTYNKAELSLDFLNRHYILLTDILRDIL